MKSIYNPFRSTAARGASIIFACFAVIHTSAHAATVDTTSTTVTYTAPQNILDTTWIGNGTLNFNGLETIRLDDTSPGGHTDFFNMTGGSITVQSGTTLRNGGYQGGNWTNNLASLDLASGGTLDVWDGTPVRVDALTGAGTVTISPAFGVNWASGRSLTVGVNGGSGTFTGNISGNSGSDGGSLSITKVGAGTQTLTGANTYSGGTTISGGTLQIGNGGSTGSYGTGPVTNNATLVLNNTSGFTVNNPGNVISGTGALTIKAGIVFVNYDTGGSVSNGTITVDGTGSSNNSSFEIWAGNGATIANNFVLKSMGPEQLRGAINQDGGAGLVTLNGSITLAGNSRIGIGGGSWNSMVINGQVTGGGKLFVYESPSAFPSTQLTLTNGVNNYSGGTEIEQGRLSITNAAALGTSAVTITGANSQLLVDEVSGTIPNNFTLGGGGNPTSTNYAYGNATMLFHNDGQTATFSGTVTLSGDAKLRGFSGGGTTIFSKPIVGTGNLTFEAGGASKDHTQYWELQGGPSTFSGNVSLFGDGYANSYLRLNGGALPSASVLTLTDQSYLLNGDHLDAVLDLNGNNQTLAGLVEFSPARGAGAFVTNGNASLSTLTINNSSDYTFTGTIGVNTAAGALGQSAGGDNIALVKSGNGTFTLSGANTYTGATTVNGGTLALGASDVLPNGTQITLGTATLDAATFTDTVGTLAVSGSGVIHLGSGAALAFADSHLLSWSGTLTLTDTYFSGSSLRFGTDANGLTPGQLAKITKPGGGAVALDSSGFLVDSASGYASWKVINAPTGTAGADYDGDGVSNGVEYVLGGTKDTNDLSKLPVVSTSGANLVFTFQRAQASIDGTTSVAIQVGTNLSTWPGSYSVPDGAQTAVPGVTVVKGNAGFDTVTLTVPRAPDGKKFARLVVTPVP